MKEKNIGVGVHYPATHLYSFYRETFGFKPGDFPHAEQVGAHICSLPLFPTMSEAQMDRVVKAVEEVLE